jgi:hypothetical protein
MALMLPTELMELLSAELCSPIEAVTMACQCDITRIKGFLVSAGQLFETALTGNARPCRSGRVSSCRGCQCSRPDS